MAIRLEIVRVKTYISPSKAQPKTTKVPRKIPTLKWQAPSGGRMGVNKKITTQK
jgi:hypothetical protein